MFVGGLSQRKGISYLFESVKGLEDKIELTIVGKGDIESCTILKHELSKVNHISSLPHVDVLNMMAEHDLLIFPSLFEGLSIVMIEAQKMKLPCFVANTISEETQISNLVHWNSLEESPKVWAERILNYKKEELCYTKLEMWDMRNIVKYLESIYEK